MRQNSLALSLAAIIWLGVMECSSEASAQGTVNDSLDGLYFGLVTPDAIQDDPRARCNTRPVPGSVFIVNGLATTIYYIGPVSGTVAADGHIDMVSAWSTVGLWPATGGLRGRILAGYGPWCKHTIELSKATPLPRPGRPVATGHKVYDARIEQDPDNPPGKCDRVGYDQRLWLRDGLAMMSWADGGTYGHVHEDGHLEMRGLERHVHLTKAGSGFVGAATKRGCRANIVRTLLISGVPE